MRCSIHYVSISQKRHLCKWTHCPFHYNSNILFWCKASLPIITEDAIFVYLIGVAGNKRLACLCCVIIEGSPARLNHTWNYTLIGPIFPQNSLMTLVRFIDKGQDVVSKACYFIISPVIDIMLTLHCKSTLSKRFQRIVHKELNIFINFCASRDHRLCSLNEKGGIWILAINNFLFVWQKIEMHKGFECYKGGFTVLHETYPAKTSLCMN